MRRIIISAVLLSVALATKSMFSFYIPLFGENGMQVGISGIFSIMPSILFGPVYGALTSGLSDLLGYVIKPTGAYLPLMTIIMAGGGFLRGVLWNILRQRSTKGTRVFVIAASALMLAVGVLDSSGGIIVSACLGFILAFADFFIAKRFYGDAEKGKTMQLLIAMLVSGLAVTTLNTVVLRETVLESWKALPFAVVWLPRAIEEILGNTVKTYFVALMAGIFEKQKNLSGLVVGSVNEKTDS